MTVDGVGVALLPELLKDAARKQARGETDDLLFAFFGEVAGDIGQQRGQDQSSDGAHDYGSDHGERSADQRRRDQQDDERERQGYREEQQQLQSVELLVFLDHAALGLPVIEVGYELRSAVGADDLLRVYRHLGAAGKAVSDGLVLIEFLLLRPASELARARRR